MAKMGANDGRGTVTYEDGSSTTWNFIVNRYTARWAPVNGRSYELTDCEDNTSYFTTREEAESCLDDNGQGPSPKERVSKERSEARKQLAALPDVVAALRKLSALSPAELTLVDYATTQIQNAIDALTAIK